MRFWPVIFCMVFSPAVAWAQTVQVRSGDHDAFTRLVFQLPARMGWTLENPADDAEAKTVRLRLDRSGLRFDTSTVFQRISGDRIADIKVDPSDNSVAIALNCACEAEAFWFQNAMLVVDIAPKPGASAPVSQQAAANPGSSATTTGQTSQPVPLPVRGGSLASSLVQDSLAQGILDTNALASGTSGVGVDPSRPNLSETRDELVRQLGRAASQGLLSPRVTLPDRAAREPDLQTPAPPKVAASETPDKTRNQRHINIQTSIDRDYLEQMIQRNLGMASECIDPARVDVSTWGSSAPFWEQVGPLRASMTGEFDRMDPRILRDLARRYVYFGFGLEALQVADELPEDKSIKVLRALAQIMEDGSAPGSVLNAQLECPEPAALWAVLSHPTLPRDIALDSDAVIRAFSALPDHLRAHLGPVLATRFTQAGLSDEGAFVLRILDRKQETQSVAADMAAAELHMAEGDIDKAEDRLSAVVESNNRLSPKALIKKIDSQIEHEKGVSFELAELAAAYAFEHSGTPLGVQLSRAYVLALGASAAFDQAFSELDKVEQETSQDMPQTRKDLASLLTQYADQVSFLKYVLSGRIGDLPLLDQDTALDMSERLFETGFYAQAQQVLTREFSGPAQRNARILRARLALGLSRPRQAEVELLGLDGDDINVLRARARSMAGDHDAARDLFLSAGLEDDANREAWLAEDWASAEGPVSSEGDDPSADVVDTAALRPGMLAQNRALLEEVSMTRDTLQDLLSQAPNPVVEN